MNPILTFLRGIRTPDAPQKALPRLLLCLALGLAMGAFSKYLDLNMTRLPLLLGELDGALDLHNFFGRMSPWIFAAVWISVRSGSPIRAAENVFLFFVGVVVSYFAYTYWFGGFFPADYVRVWVGFTLASPALAAVAWYARGRGAWAAAVTAGILAVLFCGAFSVGMWYISLRYIPDAAVLAAAVLLLRRRPREMAAVLPAAAALGALIGQLPIPYL